MQYIKRLVGVFFLIFLFYPDESFSSDNSVCDRLTGNDRQSCLDFIKKYPGEYQTEELNKDSRIYLYNKSNTIFFLDEDSVLPYPLTIVSSHRIALFGVKKSDGKKPQLTILEQKKGVPRSIMLKGLKEIYKYRLTHPSYYRKEIIGSVDQCDGCLISGFSINRDVQNYNKKIKKVFTIKGYNSVVHLNDIEATEDTHNESGYFLVEGIKSLTISNFTASSEEGGDLIEPAITIKNTPDIKLENISIDEIDVIGFTEPTKPKKIISIINPVNFTVSNLDIASSDRGQETNPVYIGLSISFKNPEEYKTTLVNGAIDQFDFSRFGVITNRAEGIRFDGTPSLWAGLVTENYRQVKGLVTVKDLTVKNGSMKANIINLPNLQIKGLDVQSTSVSTFSNVTPTLPVLLVPTLVAPSPSISRSHSRSQTPGTPAATRQVSVTRTVTPTPVDRGAENRKACNRLAKSDKRLCLKFIEKNPGDFEVKTLADNTSISIVNQSNKLFIISGTQHLSGPITIVSCNNIAIFGVKDSGGKQSMLVPGNSYKTASYIKENTIGTVFDCNNCVISGFSIKTSSSSKNKDIDRLFNVSGKNTAIHFNNLNINKEYISSYFDIDGVNSVKISNIAIRYQDHENNRVGSPAINVVNTNSVDINKFSIINFDPYLNNDAIGLITLVNPVRFKIRNTTFKGSRFSEDSGYGSIMTAIYVKFNDFNKYKYVRVNGRFSNISMTRDDGWPAHWAGITLDGKPESLASLFRGQYKNISGTVSIRKTVLPDSGGKVKKKFLPNLWVDDGTSLPPATTNPTTRLPTVTMTKTAATTTTETGAMLPKATLSKTAIMPTETVAATTPVKQTPALSTYSQTTTPTLTTSIISQPFPTTFGASQTGIPFADSKIKPSSTISGVFAKSSDVNSSLSEAESSSAPSIPEIVGACVGGAVFVGLITSMVILYCRQKLKAYPEEADLQMMPR